MKGQRKQEPFMSVQVHFSVEINVKKRIKKLTVFCERFLAVFKMRLFNTSLVL